MIWVVGGTSDANKLVDRFVAQKHKVLVSATTSYGKELAQKPGVTVVHKMLDKRDMAKLICDYHITHVVDASHPFAEVVSKNAIEVCCANKISYVRFERENTKISNALYYDDYATLINALKHSSGNILLTIGSKNVNLFNQLDIKRIIARVLPVQESIRLCESAGLMAHQIIAMKGRMSKVTNMALLGEYTIEHLVTKDSGEAGGVLEKVQAASELGVKVHILSRPKVAYPSKFANFNDILMHIEQDAGIVNL